ncbi:MAG: response regulator [Deltaproteobacteria bacterium]|nr:response regulator [Deltaproteobacteria bacterium]
MAGKVLVVDDSKTYRAVVQAYLDMDSIACTCAASGAEALAAAELEAPALVIADLMMPGMDGIELCRRIKSDPKTAAVPVIIITSNKDPIWNDRARAAGALFLLLKPFAREALMKEVTALLGGRELAAPKPGVARP